MTSIQKLRPLVRYNATLIFGAFFLVGIVTAFIFLTALAMEKAKLGYYGAAAAASLGSLIASIFVARASLKSTEFLARAVLHVSRENSTVGPPDVRNLPAGHEFMESLARTIYEMASIGAPPVVSKEAKKASSFQESLLLSTPLATFVLDKEQNLIYANEPGIAYAGLKPDAIGKKAYDVLKFSFAADTTLEQWLLECAQNRVTGTHTWERVKLTLEDGKIKQADMAVHFNKNNPAGVETVVVLFDNSDKYGKDDHGASFVSMAVHELRTPLTTMRGYIEVFEDEVEDKLDTEQREFLRKLSAQAEQLSSFVSNVQNFSRIEDGSLNLAMKEENWGQIVESVAKDMQLRASVRRKQIQLDISTDLPPVAVDRTTINEVLVNIIENAIKYTHAEEPIIIRTYKKDDSFVETTIEDKGVGINEGLIGHVFEKFYRSHRSNKAVSGTGLGLYLSKSIIAAHGGNIWVKSKEGQGSTFGFTVPTLASVADQINESGDKAIVRGAHGWIKNHELHRE